MAKKKNNDKPTINLKRNLSIYWSFLSKNKAKAIFILVIVSLIQLAYVADKFLYKVIIDKGAIFFAGGISQSVFVQILLAVLGAYVLLKVFQVIGEWNKIAVLSLLDSDIIIQIKQKYFNHIVNLDHQFHTSHKTGSLISRMNRGAGAAETMTDILIFNFLPLFIQLIAVGFSIAYFSLAPAIVIFGITIAFISYSLFIQNIQKDAKVYYNRAEDVEKGNIADIFTNIDSIRYFGKENYIKKKYLALANHTRDAAIRYWNYYKWFDAGHILIIGIGTIFLLYFPLVSFLNGELSIGTIAFIYTIYGNIVGQMFGFVHGIRGFYRAMTDFQELFEYGEIKSSIVDKADAKSLEIENGEVEFRNVTFGYNKKKLFNNFNLKINKNQKVALVGHSGCGKSSLIKLLYRMYDVEEGFVKIDGQDVKDLKQESLRSEMAIVPQECILFDDTIYNNILFARPSASRAEVLKAIKFAQLDKVIVDFPKKENTIVGERGVKLSGGEKQRVSIARAILADKRILVLDEATSALDSQTEHEIQRDLTKLMEGRTSIIIAHRLSTIMHADKIVVLEKGKIVQAGKHRQLITQNGPYKKLWNLQKGGYIKE
jgi:ABC-type multidrug transport system fused ATPase/permease subunit